MSPLIINQEQIISYISYSKQDTARLAHKIARKIQGGDILCLRGDLGMGKTTFTQNLIRFYFSSPNLSVISPTFCIINFYPAENQESEKINEKKQKYDLDQRYKAQTSPKKCSLLHCDLYRLKSAAEIEEIGLLEAINKKDNDSIIIVEWPEIITALLRSVEKSRVIDIEINVGEDKKREFTTFDEENSTRIFTINSRKNIFF